MNKHKEFLLLMKKCDYDLAAYIVLPYCSKDIRVDLILKCVKNTPLRANRGTLEDVEKFISGYRNGNVSELKLKEVVARLYNRSNASARENTIFSILMFILTDLHKDNWSDSANAIHYIHGHFWNDDYAKDLLFEISSVVWPQKSLMGAIYG